MIAPPATSAPIKVSAAAQFRALELSVLINPWKGSAIAGTLETSNVANRKLATRVQLRRFPMGVPSFRQTAHCKVRRRVLHAGSSRKAANLHDKVEGSLLSAESIKEDAVMAERGSGKASKPS